MRERQGFTLIELSIVLVIIGLIVGGILVGRELIAAAEIRAQVSQIEKYNTSVNTFRQKYGYLPGDVPSNVATRLGFFAITGANADTRGYGDGSGLIEGGVSGVTQYGETVMFWRHLSEVQMIDGNFATIVSGNPIVAASGQITSELTTGTAHQVFPRAKIGRGNHVLAYGILGANYYQLTGIECMDVGGAFDGCGPTTTGLEFAMTPIEAQSIDGKLDDGLPLAGNVRALRGDQDVNFLAAAGSPCVTAAGRYDVGSTNGNTPNCQLRIRMN